MRVPLVAGNWKMNQTIAETRQLISEMVYELSGVKDVVKVLCPPFTSLLAASALLEGTDIDLGAQNMHWENKGAYTGEISPEMISELCRYVIIGHSERRAYFGETNTSVNKKVRSALEYDLKVIVCVGETLEQREGHRTQQIVSEQVLGGLDGIEIHQYDSLIIAYEPIWAIGTGIAATPKDASRVVHDVIRPQLAQLFGDEVEPSIRILYGGSVNAENASTFFQQPDIDGALVGGASLKARDFIRIVEAAQKNS